MTTCKDINLPLCYWCRYHIQTATCNVQLYEDHIDRHNYSDKQLLKICLDIRNSIYFVAAIKLKRSHLIDKINKLTILL
jgi:hypothetical protein